MSDDTLHITTADGVEYVAQIEDIAVDITPASHGQSIKSREVSVVVNELVDVTDGDLV